MHGIITIIVVIFVISIISFFFKNFFRMMSANFGFKNVLNPHSNNQDNNPERCILKIAKKLGNKITVIDAVRECNIDTDLAEEILNNFAKKGYADMRVSDNGVVVYFFYDSETM